MLINNAGIATPRIGLMETADEDLRAMIEINLLGPMRCARAVAPQMRGRGGVIVNVGSIAGEIALGDAYSTSKSALRGYTDDLRRALRRDKIAVVLVEPGFIRQSDHTPTRLPMPGPETVARAIVHAVEHPRRTIIVPWPYRFVVFAAKLFPGAADRILSRRNVRQTVKEGESADARTET